MYTGRYQVLRHTCERATSVTHVVFFYVFHSHNGQSVLDMIKQHLNMLKEAFYWLNMRRTTWRT